MTHDDYKQIPTPQDERLEPCPVCWSNACLWQYSTSESAPTSKLVCCTHGAPIGPQDAAVYEGCPMYMPANDFYRETSKDAIRYWNEFSVALRALRKEDEMKRLAVLTKVAELSERCLIAQGGFAAAEARMDVDAMLAAADDAAQIEKTLVAALKELKRTP